MLELAAIFLAGFWAGTINVVVGSGTLVTFPVLLLFGYPPLTANISNNIGLVAGGLSGTWGYRKELTPNKDMLRRLLPASLAGGLAGAILLLVLPPSAFGLRDHCAGADPHRHPNGRVWPRIAEAACPAP